MRKIVMYCDRCGKEFKKWDHKHKEIYGIVDICYDEDEPYDDFHKDLCESCYTELEEWYQRKGLK